MAENHHQIYEKHFDPTYNTHYYFNVATQESVWELPEGNNLTVIDKTEKPGQEPDSKASQLQAIESFKQRQQALEAMEEELLAGLMPTTLDEADLAKVSKPQPLDDKTDVFVPKEGSS